MTYVRCEEGAEAGCQPQSLKLFLFSPFPLADFLEATALAKVCVNSEPADLHVPHSPGKERASGECDSDKPGPNDASLSESSQTSPNGHWEGQIESRCH